MSSINRNKKQIALVHILKKRIHLDDDMYRCLLRENFGVESCKELDPERLSELIDLLKEQLPPQQDPCLSFAQKTYILDLSRDKVTNLKAFCSTILHKHVEDIDKLTKKEAILMINALKRYHRKNI